MKIIKKGTKIPPNKIVYITECRTCGCEFSYMLHDKKPSFYYNTCLRCPQCSYEVPIPFFKKKYNEDDKQ